MNRNISVNKKITVIIVLLLVAAASAFSLYRYSKIALLDKAAYKDFARKLKEKCRESAFSSQDELRDYITCWANEEGLNYTVDASDNIIFEQPPADRKKKVSPTAVFVSYNYRTVAESTEALASAAIIAKTELESGKRTVVFANDANGTGKGYLNLSKDLITDRSKVIYIDSGDSAYLSVKSFSQAISCVRIPAKRENSSCDTSVKIHISGLSGSTVYSDIPDAPNPVGVFSDILTRLKSKSTICQLADFKVEENGNMYPAELDATVLMNSYSLNSFTEFLDNQKDKWEDAHGKLKDQISFSYTVEQDKDELPQTAYTYETFEKLTNILYIVKNSTYRYDSRDDTPEDFSEGDICGINSATGLYKDDEHNICLRIITQGYNKTASDKIIRDNQSAAALFGCSFIRESYTKAFLNTDSSLLRMMKYTYSKVNEISSAGLVLETSKDTCFTPCSYLHRTNPKSDIIHVRLNKDKGAVLTNTILCYIETKGNFLSL